MVGAYTHAVSLDITKLLYAPVENLRCVGKWNETHHCDYTTHTLLQAAASVPAPDYSTILSKLQTARSQLSGVTSLLVFDNFMSGYYFLYEDVLKRIF